MLLASQQMARRLAPTKQALVEDDLGRRAAHGDDGVVEQPSITSRGGGTGSLRIGSASKSALNGERTHRSQKRGNNIAQKELRQRRDGPTSSRVSSTPRN